MKHLMIAVLICLLLASPVAAQDTPPRTYYESLDLSSPEAAVTTLTDAFQRQDFFSVFLVLDYTAQFHFIQKVRLFRHQELFDTTHEEAVLADVPVYAAGLGSSEHVPDSIFIFDDMMLAVAKHDAFLIDLRGSISILGSKTFEFEDSGETIQAVDVSATVANIEGEVIFRTVQAPSGRWRVRQVIVPGGDEELLPWSIPDSDSS